jgi:hypothetical protein
LSVQIASNFPVGPREESRSERGGDEMKINGTAAVIPAESVMKGG